MADLGGLRILLQKVLGSEGDWPSKMSWLSRSHINCAAQQRGEWVTLPLGRLYVYDMVAYYATLRNTYRYVRDELVKLQICM